MLLGRRTGIAVATPRAAMPQRHMATELLHLAVCDFTALLRGRGFPASELDSYLARGCGWVPANQAVTAFDSVAACPDGSTGDLRLMPDASTRTRIAPGGDRPALDFYLCDMLTPDGAPWGACARSFLKSAVAALETAGYSLQIGLEHEFSLLDPQVPASHSFSLRRVSRYDRFLADLLAALDGAGVAPEMVLPEYGPAQFEVVLPPAPPLLAADRAVILREAVRMVADTHGLQASFAPKLSPDVVGNGVHVHLGLMRGGAFRGRLFRGDPQEQPTEPCMYEAGAPGDLSATARSFCAGIVRDLPDFVALTAASPPSFLRLRPHGWSVAANCVGLQCREASLRVCPAPTPLHDKARAHHVEFRAADATANPYVLIGALIRAGLGGLADSLPLARVFTEDLAELDQAALKARGIAPLPATLGAALDRMAAAPRVAAWAPPLFWTYYQAHKRLELAEVTELGDAETCLRYARVY